MRTCFILEQELRGDQLAEMLGDFSFPLSFLKVEEIIEKRREEKKSTARGIIGSHPSGNPGQHGCW